MDKVILNFDLFSKIKKLVHSMSKITNSNVVIYSEKISSKLFFYDGEEVVLMFKNKLEELKLKEIKKFKVELDEENIIYVLFYTNDINKENSIKEEAETSKYMLRENLEYIFEIDKLKRKLEAKMLKNINSKCDETKKQEFLYIKEFMNIDTQLRQVVCMKFELSNKTKVRKLFYNISYIVYRNEIKGILDIGENFVELILLEVNSTNEIREIVKKMEEIDEEFRIGIGGIHKLTDINKSIEEANIALTALNGKEIKVSYYNDLGIYKILLNKATKEETIKFYKETIQKLEEYDERKSTDLVKTLNSYFDNNGNIKKISDSMYTHYNTIVYRLNRIQEITNLNLDNRDDRLRLEIALKIKEVM